MESIALIAGSGGGDLGFSDEGDIIEVGTPYGEPSAPIRKHRFGRFELYFLQRHGVDGNIPPHRINYRANLWALRECGVSAVVALNTVGGISAEAQSGSLVFPDQLVDYTWGRAHSYSEGGDTELQHIEFSNPFSPELVQELITAAKDSGLSCLSEGTYAVTQGPRLETAAEIDRLERDGCHIVGMTAMPEAGLARELNLPYASCSIVVNVAAGRGPDGIHDQIREHMASGMAQVALLLRAWAGA
jgi:5'-methylthioinosine phosphorylase